MARGGKFTFLNKNRKNLQTMHTLSAGFVFSFPYLGIKLKLDAMKIHELSTDERPREKLQAKGAEALSNAELLAIILRTGTGDMNAVDVGRKLLREGGDTLTGLSGMSMEQMCTVPGIGKDKATSIAALFELGKRFAYEGVRIKRIGVYDPEEVFKMMRLKLKGIDHEECWVLYLNRANYVISTEKMSSGGLTATVVDCNLIIKTAVNKKATGIIMVHNHPSGDTCPGVQDKTMTGRLKKALEPYGIKLFDHVIVSDDSYYSFDSGENTIVSDLALLAEK